MSDDSTPSDLTSNNADPIQNSEVASQESSSSPSVNIKEGYLHKKGAVNKNWKLRWFTIVGDTLEYSTDKYRRNKKGSIPLTDVTEIGVLSHETRSFCFGLNTSKRLWVLSAETAEVRELWMTVLRNFQPRPLDPGSKVPHTAIGSIKKTIMKKMATTNSNRTDSAGDKDLTFPHSASSSAISPPTSPRNNATQNNSNAPADSPASPSNYPASTLLPITKSSPEQQKTSNTTINVASSPPHQTALSLSPPSSVSINRPAISLETRSTVIQFGNPNSIQVHNPTTFANWTPKLAWTPTTERPAWCYELVPGLAPTHSAWLSPLLSAATRFNMGWAFILDWVRRIGHPNYTDSVILENIKQGLNKLQPCWTEFEKAAALAETWDPAHSASIKIRNQISELHTLSDTKIAGWHVQLSSKTAIDGESEFEFTYRRAEQGTPERPAWYLIPSNPATESVQAFKLFESAASTFNDAWSVAFELSRSIVGSNKTAAVNLKDQIVAALNAVDVSWKEFDACVTAFEDWNPLSLYTLEIKQQIGSLKRLYDSSRREWISSLESRNSFVPINKYNYQFELDRPSTTPDRPAWFFKFNLSTPNDLSRGLIALSSAANQFNSHYSVAYQWAAKIGRNAATKIAIQEGMETALNNLVQVWPNFEESIVLMQPWEIACTDIIRQVSQLRGLIEESRTEWNRRLNEATEIATFRPPDDFRLSGFGNDTRFSGESTISSTMPTTNEADARILYEHALAGSREAATIAEFPNTKLNFVPGLGPGSFTNGNVYKAILNQLYKAQQIPGTSADQVEKIRSLIVECQQKHRAVCFTWALYYAKEGNMPRSIEFYEALHDVLPDAVADLDKELAVLRAEFESSSGSASIPSV